MEHLPEDKRLAPKGAIYVCAACGEISWDLYEMDVSCAMTAILCHDEKVYDETLKKAVWYPYEFDLPDTEKRR